MTYTKIDWENFRKEYMRKKTQKNFVTVFTTENRIENDIRNMEYLRAINPEKVYGTIIA